DAAGADVRAGGHLGRAEVPAPSPQRTTAGKASGLIRLPERGRLAGRPAPRDRPGVEPAEDVAEPGHRVAGERLARRAKDADLHAQPALAIDPRQRMAEVILEVLDVLAGAERAAGPDDRQQLRDVAGHRIPHQMARP